MRSFNCECGREYMVEPEELSASPDPETSFSWYSHEAKRTRKHQGDLLFPVVGLTGEIGEIAEPIKKHLFHGKTLDREALLQEVGDVLWYLEALASDLGSSLGEVARENIAKLRLRHPPQVGDRIEVYAAVSESWLTLEVWDSDFFSGDRMFIVQGNQYPWRWPE